MRRSLKVKWNKELIIAILFFGPQINYYLAALCSLNGLATPSLMVYALLYSLGIFSYFVTLRFLKSFCAFAFFVLSVSVSVLFNDKVITYMFAGTVFQSGIVVLVLLYFPMFLLLITEFDYEKLMKFLIPFSRTTLIVAIIAFFDYLKVNRSTTPDYMSFAYMMLTPILICFIVGVKGHVVDRILSIIGSFVIFVVGCRGAVVSLAAFFLLYILYFYLPKREQKSSWGKLVLIPILLSVVVFFEKILVYISLGLEKIGFSSRTVNKLLAGTDAFVESEGRKTIWDQAMNNIGIIGKGLFGDRTVLVDEYSRSVYAHNFALEILIDFGLLIGSILLLIMLVIIVRVFILSLKSQSLLRINLLFVAISILLVKHMLSASFLTSFDFWFYMGMLLNMLFNMDSIEFQSNLVTKEVDGQ